MSKLKNEYNQTLIQTLETTGQVVIPNEYKETRVVFNSNKDTFDWVNNTNIGRSTQWITQMMVDGYSISLKIGYDASTRIFKWYQSSVSSGVKMTTCQIYGIK